VCLLLTDKEYTFLLMTKKRFHCISFKSILKGPMTMTSLLAIMQFRLEHLVAKIVWCCFNNGTFYVLTSRFAEC
jgi:hypothetical protein